MNAMACTAVAAMPLTSVATSTVSVTTASTAGQPSTLHLAPKTTAVSSKRTVIGLGLSISSPPSLESHCPDWVQVSTELYTHGSNWTRPPTLQLLLLFLFAYMDTWTRLPSHRQRYNLVYIWFFFCNHSWAFLLLWFLRCFRPIYYDFYEEVSTKFHFVFFVHRLIISPPKSPFFEKTS